MFTLRELATILAALRFWQEEMCPHGHGIMRPYFEAVEMPGVVPLSAEELDRLSERLRRLNTS